MDLPHAAAAPGHHRLEWVVWLALGILLLIAAAIAYPFLPDHIRRKSRGWGWWW